MVFPFRWLYALEVIGGYWWILQMCMVENPRSRDPRAHLDLTL